MPARRYITINFVINGVKSAFYVNVFRYGIFRFICIVKVEKIARKITELKQLELFIRPFAVQRVDYFVVVFTAFYGLVIVHIRKFTVTFRSA